jgi:hypothetical protein
MLVMVLGVPSEHEWLVPKLRLGNDIFMSKLCLDTFKLAEIAKQELGAQGGSQPLAWEPD